MSHKSYFNHCLICAFILIAGLGLAFVLPWLANSQSRAAQGDTGAYTSASDVNMPGGAVNSSSVERLELAPTTPITIHVAKTGNGTDGLNWTKAYTNVQDALNAAGSGDEIWVASGVYTPGLTVNDTFQLLDDISIYGGFAATETLRTQRDWLANVTILSGDIAGDDTTDTNGVVTDSLNINGTNSYHVVTGSGVTTTAVLDGFTITAGQADGYYSAPCGPQCGGGMYNDNGNPSLRNVVFSGNLARYKGGGMFNYRSNPALTNVVFSGNSVDDYGGGMYNYDCSPVLTKVVFSGNSVDDYGGGMYSHISSPALTNVAFSGNLANYGGGMYNDISSPALTNVAFSGNSASYEGGGMFNRSSSPALTNVVFSGNSADIGGGMYNKYSSSPDVRNSILWNNQDNSGTGTITATIYIRGTTISLTHSLVQGTGGSNSWISDASFVDGGGNIDTNPLFMLPIDPSTAPTTTGNLRLQSSSPAIDGGDNTYIEGFPTDLDGEPRIVDGNLDGTPTVDMGAYEKQIEEVYIYMPLILH